MSNYPSWWKSLPADMKAEVSVFIAPVGGSLAYLHILAGEREQPRKVKYPLAKAIVDASKLLKAKYDVGFVLELTDLNPDLK